MDEYDKKIELEREALDKAFVAEYGKEERDTKKLIKNSQESTKNIKKLQQNEFANIEEQIKKDPKKIVLELLTLNKKLKRSVAEKTVKIRMLENQADQMVTKLQCVRDLLNTEDSFGSIMSWQRYNQNITDKNG